MADSNTLISRSMTREEFREVVDCFAHNLHVLAFSYPGDREEPGYCLLTHSAELLDLINELHLV